ncbi:MAG: GNAT family N-acetyltransferase [Lawsonibacter sp.]|nr:GNAT family N-acetyltransferase [Lawsonibacter sp.]
MTTIYLIRHAEAEGNLYRRIHGWYDSLITENGFRQIAALEQRFRDIPVDAVWSSDLYRTMTTARAVYKPKGLELHTDPGLRELNFSAWEDLTFGEAYHFHREEMALFNRASPAWRAPGGESLAEAGARGERAIRRIAEKHPDQTVAVFCHGTVIRQLMANVRGMTPEEWPTLPHSENTAVTCLTFDGEELRPVFEGDASHLPEEITTMGKQRWWRRDGKAEDVNLWYRPIDWAREQDFYLNARREAWTATHGPRIPFRGEDFLSDARRHLEQSPWGVTVAMVKEEPMGLVQLDQERYREEGAGYIPFCYVAPQWREQELGVQLLGQAVSCFRPLGRDKLRLRCAPYNDRAQHFYQKYGFTKIGEEQNSRVPLDILEKYIGYER